MTRTKKAPEATSARPTSPWAAVRTQSDYKRVLSEQREAGAAYSPAALERAMMHASSTLRLYGEALDYVSRYGTGNPRFDDRIESMENGEHAVVFDPASHEPEPEPGPLSPADEYAALRARAVAGEPVRPAELHAAKQAAEAAELADEIAAERDARERSEDAARRKLRSATDSRIVEALDVLDDVEVRATAQAVRDALAGHRAAVGWYNGQLAAVRDLIDTVYPDKPSWGDSDEVGFHPDRHSFRGSQSFVWDGVAHHPRGALALAR